jgi:hypothetical protein
VGAFGPFSPYSGGNGRFQATERIKPLSTSGYREVDMAEYARGIVDAARHLAHLNHNVLSDPHVRLLLELRLRTSRRSAMA